MHILTYMNISNDFKLFPTELIIEEFVNDKE